ncbi:MAG TPA: lipocalin family protein [Salegentibacter sp.]|nr:lipocalin family protein [Salegentibacter sp.]
MKTPNIFYLILICFTLFSCGSEDDTPANNPELQAELQGVWLYEGLTFDGTFESFPEAEVHYDFKPGGILDVIYEEGTESGTYQINGDDLTIKMDGENVIYAIVELTATELVLFTEAEVNEEPGLDEVTFHFSRD